MLQIVELILDNCYSTMVVGLTDEFVNLERLSLIKVGLTNLKNFPNLPNLTRVSEISWRRYKLVVLRLHPAWGILKVPCTLVAVVNIPIPYSSFPAGTWRKQDNVRPTVTSGITKISAFEP